MDNDNLKKRVQHFMGTINDYNALPTTPYRKFVDDIQDRIAFVNAQKIPDDVRLSLLKGSLLGLLGINLDDIKESSEDA